MLKKESQPGLKKKKKTWGWVNYDICISGWSIPLRYVQLYCGDIEQTRKQNQAKQT